MTGTTAQLASILRESAVLYPILRKLPQLSLPNCYVCAGCIAQTVWNRRFGFSPEYGIDDIDIIYYDIGDMTKEGETETEARVRTVFPGLPHRLDVKNEARVHLWYEQKFGYSIRPYVSTEDAILSFPTTATAVGARWTPSGLHIYAPYGLDDLLDGIIRPNKAQVTQAIYRQKADKWLAKWPSLQIMSW